MQNQTTKAATTTPLVQKHCTDYARTIALIYTDTNSTSHAKVKTNVTAKALLQKQSCAAICKQKTTYDIDKGLRYGFGFQSTEACAAVNDQAKT